MTGYFDLLISENWGYKFGPKITTVDCLILLKSGMCVPYKSPEAVQWLEFI